MSVYVLKRIAAMLPTLFGVTIVVFLLLKLLPGTVVEQMLGSEGDEEAAEALRQFFGLDRPLHEQYLNWIGNILVGDFGVSWRTGQDILTTLLEAFVVTGELAVFAVLVSALIGIPLGLLAALRPYGPIDHLLRIFSLTGVSVPVFFQGTVLIVLFSLFSPWKPPVIFEYPWDSLSMNLQIMILPAFALGLASSAVVMRMTRSSLLDTLGQDFIRTARAKGLKESIVIFRHALKTVMISVVTALGLEFGQILGGIVVVEVVFSLPGVGQTIFNALVERDFPLVQSGILMITFVTLCINTIVDIAYAYIDPRIRYK
jgi:peptide/nickel transport system permease protein